MHSNQEPRSRTRRLIRALLWTAGLLVLLFVVALPAVWLLGGEWLADRAGVWVNQGPLKGSGSRLTLGKIQGKPWGELIIDDAALLVPDSLGIEVPVVKASRLSIQFQPLHLLRGDFSFSNVEARQLEVRLVSKPGGFLLPQFLDADQPSSTAPPPSAPFHLTIDHFKTQESAFYLGLPDLPLQFTRLDADFNFRLDEDGAHLEPRHFAADLNDSLGRVELTYGSLTMGGPAGTVIDSLGGTWNDSELTLFLHEDGAGIPRLRVVSGRREGRMVGGLLGIPNLEPALVERVDVSMALGETLQLEGTGTGSWDVYRVEDAGFTAELKPEAFTVGIRQGKIWGGNLRGGHIRVPTSGPGVEARVVFQHLDLARALKAVGQTPLAGQLTGEAQIRIADRDRPTEGHDIQLKLSSGHLLEIPIESLELTARGGMESGYDLVDAAVTLARASFEVTGKVSPTLVDADVEFWGNLRPLRRMVPIEDLDGEGDLSATIFGPPDSLVVSAQGFVENFVARGTHIPRIDFKHVRGPIVEGRQLEVGFEITQPFSVAGAATVDTVRGDIRLEENGAQLTRFHLAMGDTTLDVTGNVAWAPVMRAALETGVARIGSRTFTLLRPAVVTYDQNVVTADSLALKTIQGVFVASGAYDPKKGWMEVTFDLQDLDPWAVVPRGLMPALEMSRIDGSLSLSGSIPVLDGTASVSIKDFRYNDFAVDSLSTVLSVTGPVIQVDRFAASRGRGKVLASGSVRMAGPLYTVLEREVFGPDIPGDETHWDLDFQTRDIYLGEWFSFMRSKAPRGLVTSRLHIGGDSLHPTVRLWALADAVNIGGFFADHMNAKIEVGQGRVLVDTLEVWLKGEPFQLSGTFPLDLSFKPFSLSVPEAPMDLVLQSQGGSLRNLMVTPWIDRIEGTFTGQVAATGTPRDPRLAGELNAHADSVAIHDRADVVRDANVWVTLEDKVIRVVAAEGMLGGGRVTARGTYSPFAKEQDSYRLNLTMDKAVVREPGVYAARVSGELAVEPRTVEGIVYPFVSGDIRVHRAEYIGALQPQDVSSTKARAFLYDVTIDAPSKIIVQTTDVRGELSANVRAVQTPARLELQGQMDILEGEWYTPTAKFKVVDGTMTWASTTTILPELDVTMQTHSGGYLIEVRVTGRADEPELSFTAYDPDTHENAGLSTEEIYRQLFLVGSGHLTTESALVTGSKYVFRGFEQEILGRTGIIDDLAIDPTTTETGQTSYVVSVRKFLTPELSLRFGQELSRYFDPNFALEYRLGRALFLRGETVRERTLDASTVTTRYQLDVSARYDY